MRSNVCACVTREIFYEKKKNFVFNRQLCTTNLKLPAAVSERRADYSEIGKNENRIPPPSNDWVSIIFSKVSNGLDRSLAEFV